MSKRKKEEGNVLAHVERMKAEIEQDSKRPKPTLEDLGESSLATHSC